MKIRNDFVTNSSSSSFCIAYKDMPEVDKKTLEKYPFIAAMPKLVETVLEFGNPYGETTEAAIFKNKEEYDNYFMKEYGWSRAKTIHDIIDDDEYLKELYHSAVDYLKLGYSIAVKDISYGDDGLKKVLEVLAEDNDSFILLEDE